MITEKERIGLKEAFPSKYGKTIADRLNEKGFWKVIMIKVGSLVGSI